MHFTVCISQNLFLAMHFTVCISQYAFHNMHSQYAFHNVNFTVCILVCISQNVYDRMHFTVCILQCAFYSVHFTVCISQYAFHSMHLTVWISQYAFHNMHFSMYCSMHFTFHSMHVTVCIFNYAFHSMHITVCISHYAFHSMHFTLFTLPYGEHVKITSLEPWVSESVRYVPLKMHTLKRLHIKIDFFLLFSASRHFNRTIKYQLNIINYFRTKKALTSKIWLDSKTYFCIKVLWVFSGGTFVLEPQAFSTYRKKKKLTEKIFQNFQVGMLSNLCLILLTLPFPCRISSWSQRTSVTSWSMRLVCYRIGI